MSLLCARDSASWLGSGYSRVGESEARSARVRVPASIAEGIEEWMSWVLGPRRGVQARTLRVQACECAIPEVSGEQVTAVVELGP